MQIIIAGETAESKEKTLKVLKLLSDGHNYSFIARQIGCKQRTVEVLIFKMLILNKPIGIVNRLHLVCMAMRNGLIH